MSLAESPVIESSRHRRALEGQSSTTSHNRGLAVPSSGKAESKFPSQISVRPTRQRVLSRPSRPDTPSDEGLKRVAREPGLENLGGKEACLMANEDRPYDQWPGE